MHFRPEVLLQPSFRNSFGSQHMIRILICLLVLSGVAFASYKIGFSEGSRKRNLEFHLENMVTLNALYAAAEHGQFERLKASLGVDAFMATLMFERTVPESERNAYTLRYSQAKQLREKLDDGKEWTKDKDWLWAIDPKAPGQR
jgi:hypothetical protein